MTFSYARYLTRVRVIVSKRWNNHLPLLLAETTISGSITEDELVGLGGHFIARRKYFESVME